MFGITLVDGQPFDTLTEQFRRNPSNKSNKDGERLAGKWCDRDFTSKYTRNPDNIDRAVKIVILGVLNDFPYLTIIVNKQASVAVRERAEQLAEKGLPPRTPANLLESRFNIDYHRKQWERYLMDAERIKAAYQLFKINFDTAFTQQVNSVASDVLNREARCMIEKHQNEIARMASGCCAILNTV